MKTVLMSLAMLASVSSAFGANNYRCKQTLENGLIRTVIVGQVFMVCESPAGLVLNSMELKTKYCAAAMLNIVDSGGTVGDSAEGSITGITSLSALNDMPASITVQLSYKQTGSSLVGKLVLSSGELSKTPAIDLPLETDGYSCTTF